MIFSGCPVYCSQCAKGLTELGGTEDMLNGPTYQVPERKNWIPFFQTAFKQFSVRHTLTFLGHSSPSQSGSEKSGGSRKHLEILFTKEDLAFLIDE